MVVVSVCFLSLVLVLVWFWFWLIFSLFVLFFFFWGGGGCWLVGWLVCFVVCFFGSHEVSFVCLFGMMYFWCFFGLVLGVPCCRVWLASVRSGPSHQRRARALARLVPWLRACWLPLLAAG